jgi:hypothetical protein
MSADTSSADIPAVLDDSVSSNPNRSLPEPLILKTVRKVKFTPEEDVRLTELCKQAGPCKDWPQIAAELGNRSPRQCRDRYKNYLNPELSSAEWTAEEDELLASKVEDCGIRWNRIAEFFEHRSEIALRNRWLSISRRREKERSTAALTREPRHIPIVLPILVDPSLANKPVRKEPRPILNVYWPEKPIISTAEFWKPHR